MQKCGRRSLTFCIVTAVTAVTALLLVATSAADVSSPASATTGDCVYGDDLPGVLPGQCSDPGTVIAVTGDDSQIDASLSVPEPGTGVGGGGIGRNGLSLDIELHTLTDGTVETEMVYNPGAGDSSTYDPTQSSGPSDCSDTAYNRTNSYLDANRGIKWYSSFDWYFNTSTTPSNLASSDTTTALITATMNITHENNNCSLADNMSGTEDYQSSTTRYPNIPSGQNTCGTRDGYNVNGFGTTSGDYIAWTCWWLATHAVSGPDSIVESDTRFDKSSTSWYIPGVTSCSSGSYSIEATATHERGHTYGLDHVPESGHGNLTMSPAMNGPCQNQEASLGLGDVSGLNALY